MNIIAYIKSLLPSFSKNRIVDDARVTYAELESAAVPAYADAEKVFHNWKVRSSVMKEFTTTFKRIVKSDAEANIVIAISRGLTRILESKTFIQDKVEAHFESEVITDGISCVKANLLRILETTTFITDYSLLLLNYIYILETAEVVKESGYVRSSLSPAEIDYLHKNFTDFCLAFNALAKEKAKFSKIVDNIPDVLLDINTGETIIGTLGEDKADPLMMRGFSGNTNNPIYHLRLHWAEMQIAKYKRNKELKKVLELRLLNLNMQLEKTPDAKIEKEINYVQGRVQGLDHEIKKMEEGV